MNIFSQHDPYDDRSLFEMALDWVFEDDRRTEVMWIAAVSAATWGMTLSVLLSGAGVAWLCR